MKQGFRQSMAWLHAWAGLVVAWVLYFMFLTGTTGYFDTEIDRWMRPERPLVTPDLPVEEAIDIGLQRLRAVAPGAQQWSINPGGDRDNPDLRVFYRYASDADGNQGRTGSESLDATTGQPISVRATGGGQTLYRMHYEFRYMPTAVAYWIAGVCTMFMLVAIVSGVIVHKKIFKDFFTFRPAKKQRSWLDAHNVLSVVALPFHFMITYSGLIFFMLTYMPLIVTASYGPGPLNRQTYIDEMFVRAAEPEAAGVAAPMAALAPMMAEALRRWGPEQVRYFEVRHPGDANAIVTLGRVTPSPLRNSERLVFGGVSGELIDASSAFTSPPKAVRDVFLGLHEGLFAAPLLRWLYFLSGLLGTAMIATGLVLWTAKRRTQQRAGGEVNAGLVLVERLNVGTLVGLPIGIAVYFWANRLIPVAFEDRAAWEVHAMFIAWALMLVHAQCRTVEKSWREQLWLCAVLCACLPVLNAATTDRHLGTTLLRGDWVLAGFDLTLLAFGLAFAAAALKVQAHAKVASVPRRHRSAVALSSRPGEA